MVTRKTLVLVRFTILLLISVWVSAVCWRSSQRYQEEMNRPPSSYLDITQGGFTDVTVMSHATATADAFFVTVLAQSVPILFFGLTVFWVLGQLPTRSNTQVERTSEDRPIRKFKFGLNEPE
jgi:hypothetical protein